MPHISLPQGFPGVRSLFMYSPETAKPLNDLVQTLLHDPATSTLTPGERELIAAYTSSLNECTYCASTHGAIAKYQLGVNGDVVKEVMNDPATAEISPKLKTLMKIAAKVQQSGRKVTPADIDAARAGGATDREIHDTVLIAATFCLFNRYVDGLATWAPDDPAVYDAIGKQRAGEGYLTKPFKITQP
ncbi:MAG TPA: peroxidase-related enzyme [Verrucomicrobiae bacterium]|nr:peroxidase-related enzyme [Verrucomicrobiae bacterium]